MLQTLNFYANINGPQSFHLLLDDPFLIFPRFVELHQEYFPTHSKRAVLEKRMGFYPHTHHEPRPIQERGVGNPAF